jgi:endonuclease VIII
MPEGHVTHRVARDHGKLLNGQRIAVSSPQGRFEADAALVDGAVLDRIEAYGKHVFYHWSTGHVGHVHLGLFGKYRVSKHPGAAPPEPIGMVRMRMSTPDVTIDLAGPTDCSIGTIDDRNAIVARLGPDPLRRDAKPEVAIAKMARTSKAMGAALLDQSIVAGIGNVYRAEALFVNGIHPERAGRDCSPEELQAMWTTLAGMLKQGLREGRIVTVSAAELDIPKGRLRRGEATYVYHRDRCLRSGTPVETVELGGRPCWFCPTCQPS